MQAATAMGGLPSRHDCCALTAHVPCGEVASCCPAVCVCLGVVLLLPPCPYMVAWPFQVLLSMQACGRLASFAHVTAD